MHETIKILLKYATSDNFSEFIIKLRAQFSRINNENCKCLSRDLEFRDLN